MTRVLKILEASRNASRFADTIEYSTFKHTSGIEFNRVLQSITEVFAGTIFCFRTSHDDTSPMLVTESSHS